MSNVPEILQRIQSDLQQGVPESVQNLINRHSSQINIEAVKKTELGSSVLSGEMCLVRIKENNKIVLILGQVRLCEC